MSVRYGSLGASRCLTALLLIPMFISGSKIEYSDSGSIVRPRHVTVGSKILHNATKRMIFVTFKLAVVVRREPTNGRSSRT
jgi:hypothetical protein